MLFESWGIWVFSAFNGGATFITYLAMVSSAILFSTASAFSLHHIKIAAILGITALIGVFPFGIHWLLYRYEFESPLIHGAENQIALFATVIYTIGVFYSIKYTVKYKTVSAISLRMPFKIFLTCLPPALLLILIVLGFINP
jgi:hypothetical protein